MKLTEDMVIARSRGAELNSIRKLNCWGSEISDVSVVRKLPNIEVLALSVNNVTTLADFQHCPNLAELYIRQNNIKDLNEVVYLKELPKLRALWLADNPCAQRDNYRLTMLRALPHLQKLDNTTVESEEVQKAMIQGDDLMHPLDALEMQQRQQQRRAGPDSRRSSHASATSGAGYDRYQQQPQSYQEEREPARYQESRADPEQEPAPRARSPDYYPAQAQQNYPQAPYRAASPQYYESAAAAPAHYYEDSRSPTDAPQQRASFSSYRESAPAYRDPPATYRDSRQVARRSLASPDRQYAGSASDGDGYRGSDTTPTPAAQAYSSEHNSLRQYDARPKKKSPNVLSAVLCLVKELDLHGLEVVDTAVRCRIQELED